MANLRKNITDYDSLFNEMKRHSMFTDPHETVDTFLQKMTAGENWYSNGIVEIKIFKWSNGRDELVNHRGLIHPVIELFFVVA